MQQTLCVCCRPCSALRLSTIRIGYAHPDRLFSYPDARYLSACIMAPVVMAPVALPAHGRGDQSQHLTAELHKFCGSLQPGNCGTKLSLHAQNGPKCAFFGEQGECCHANLPPTGHAGRMLSRKTLQSGCAGQVPPRHQLRGRTLTPQCACKPLDMHMGGAAHTHTIGPTDGASGPRAPSGVHTQARDAVFTGTRQTRPTKIVTFPRDKAEKLSLPATRFVHPHSWSQPTKIPTFPHQ